MKISKLHIDTFRHLKNLDFDFTYPEDFHIEEKRGKPLDKICLIGQSATGKTSLLELIFEHILKIFALELIDNTYLAGLSNPIKDLNGEINLFIDDEILKLRGGEIDFKNQNYKFKNKGGTITPLIPYQNQKDVFYFKANIISDKNIDIFSKNPIDLFERYPEQNIPRLGKKNDYTLPSTVFDDKVDTEIWLSLLSKILYYRKNFTQKMSELIHKGLLGDQKKLDIEYKKWQKENPNAIADFAKKFNPILEKLNLEVDLVNTEYSIPIKNKKTDEIIPIQSTSTGTKGLLLSFLPLFKLDTKDSIILIDEPERSLYPDMQMDLMDHYQNLAPDAQFIVATHSPFIAASFEPEERFILYFDQEGKVAVRRGESPIGDDPNDILNNDFGVNYYNKHAKEAYQKYISLKQKMASENDPKRKKELLLKTVKLGDTYNF
ncbi:putative ATP-dependent endonuclease of OLD family [Flavobacterium sp. PL11]|uniref:AAA family ATPase n=1 Tax=Flavobacterium sp. PL11 TaxID=3071717 RepID=UPI002DFB5413|nr:putative ATP-dependent endonuclease of OLD family [Flavobacterium sp. PL11]